MPKDKKKSDSNDNAQKEDFGTYCDRIIKEWSKPRDQPDFSDFTPEQINDLTLIFLYKTPIKLNINFLTNYLIFLTYVLKSHLNTVSKEKVEALIEVTKFYIIHQNDTKKFYWNSFQRYTATIFLPLILFSIDGCEIINKSAKNTKEAYMFLTKDKESDQPSNPPFIIENESNLKKESN